MSKHTVRAQALARPERLCRYTSPDSRHANMRRIMLDQQRALAEVQGQIKALIALQGGRR